MNVADKSDLNSCPRLIEVALPIREISAESVRQKSAQRGHISTLHIWWARRPLATSRAVVFASLVPDPDDPRCPEEFRKAIEQNLRTHVPTALKHYTRGSELKRDEDPYRPYEDIPDTLRNRLLAFIAKWSPESLAFEAGKSSEEPKPDMLLDDRSLVKWETSDPENSQGSEVLRIARDLIKRANGGKTLTVLDPFAGGGAIPLEAARLGCQSIANDYNPVAYLILRATCEFPQKYGQPGKRRVLVEELGAKVERLISIPNVFAHDLERWAKWIVERARAKIGDLYPTGGDGRAVVGYLWARTAPCSNPSCRAEIPLLRSLLICNKQEKKVAVTITPDRHRMHIAFGVAKGKEIKRTQGTKRERGPAICPYPGCRQATSEDDLRRAGQGGQMGERMVAVIVEGPSGKEYRPCEQADIGAFEMAALTEIDRPNEPIEEGQWNVKTWLYGMKTWGSLFNARQLLLMNTLVDCTQAALRRIKKEEEDNAYKEAIAISLAIWISRSASRYCRLTRWDSGEEKFQHPFSRQAIPMTWDYPEANPFSAGSGGLLHSLDYLLRVLKREANFICPAEVLLGDAAKIPKAEQIDVVVTDPPYFDQIAYGDLSDYFYVWLKRMLYGVIPDPFGTPLTPKSEEATALRHRHGGDEGLADEHFKRKLCASFAEAQRLIGPDGMVCVMFAHQSNKAWSALIRSILDAGLTIDASWPINTELKNRMLAINTSALETSVTVACRSRKPGAAASLKEVRCEIKEVVQESVKRFWSYGFRGADLIVACYGPAVGVFGKYERVEKADGTRVEIPELLELSRRAARDAIAGEFRGDNLSTLYYVWANLYGVSLQAWDDARLVVQIGGDADNAMEVARGHGIFVVDGSTCRLALLADRSGRRGLGVDPSPPLIDAVHRAMLLWKQEKRRDLVAYLAERDLLEDGPFWKLAQALFDVLPRDQEDWKLVNALLRERQTLRVEGKRGLAAAESQQKLYQA